MNLISNRHFFFHQLICLKKKKTKKKELLAFLAHFSKLLNNCFKWKCKNKKVP